jgi:hypothetical protein
MRPSRNADNPQPPASETAETPAESQPASPLFLTPSDQPATADHPPADHPSSPLASPSDHGDGSPDSASRARSTDPARVLSPAARLRVFKGIARDAIETVGQHANALLVRNPADRELGVWLPDAEDAKEIGEPLAGIANRRIPKGTAADNPDAADLFRLGVGLVGYVLKSLKARARARVEYADWYAGARAAETVAGGLPDDQKPEPAPVPTDPPEDMLSPGRAYLAGRFGHSDAGQSAGDSPDPARAG